MGFHFSLPMTDQVHKCVVLGHLNILCLFLIMFFCIHQESTCFSSCKESMLFLTSPPAGSTSNYTCFLTTSPSFHPPLNYCFRDNFRETRGEKENKRRGRNICVHVHVSAHTNTPYPPTAHKDIVVNK